jgi:PST family polysaccharide transporter
MHGSDPKERAVVTQGTAARGLAFTGIAQAIRLAVGLGANVLLARLLLPQDFGIVAMVAPIVAFATLLQDLGFSQVVIQRERMTREQLSALFLTSSLISMLLAGILIALAHPIALFYREPRVEALVVAFSAVLVLSGIQAIPGALLSRNLRFGTSALIDTVATVLGFGAGVVFALMYHSYWALYVTPLVTMLTMAIAKLAACGWRPSRPSFEGDLRSIAGFSSGVSGTNILNFIAQNADAILIARVHGTVPLGLYDRANKLLALPLLQINIPLGRVMTPILSRLQTEPERYRKAFADCMTLMLAISQPALLVATVFAHEIVTIVLGSQWTAAAPIFQWLGIAWIHRMLTNNLGWILLSQGRARDYFITGAFASTTTVLSFIVGLPFGPVGVAAALAISDWLVRLPFIWAIVGRTGPVSLRDLLRIAVPHGVAVAACTVFLVAIFVNAGELGFLRLVAVGFAAYAVYLAVLVCFPSKRNALLARLKRPLRTPGASP